MSYVLKPSSGGGSGVQNPMTANLEAAGFDIENVDTLTGTNVRVDSVVGLISTAGATVIAATELAHQDPMGTVGFYGVPPKSQQVVAFPIVGADPVQNEDTINQICFALQALGLIQ
jgi:hypothetical protein